MNRMSNGPSRKRRAILQGTLAAPVVLTVSSPTAAQMTTVGRCMANFAKEKPAFLVTTDDTWLRKQVDIVKLSRGGSSQHVTDWVFFDEAVQDYVTVAPPHTPLEIGPIGRGWQISATGTPRWGLVWVDERTKSISSKTQVQAPRGSTAVTESCWTSFKT